MMQRRVLSIWLHTRVHDWLLTLTWKRLSPRDEVFFSCHYTVGLAFDFFSPFLRHEQKLFLTRPTLSQMLTSQYPHISILSVLNKFSNIQELPSISIQLLIPQRKEVQICCTYKQYQELQAMPMPMFFLHERIYRIPLYLMITSDTESEIYQFEQSKRVFFLISHCASVLC